MSVSVKNLIPSKMVEATQVTQYTANGLRARIDKCTVTNTSASNVTFSANLVPVAGTASATNLVIAAKTIVPNETYSCPELIGQTLEVGGFISTIADTAAVLSIRASGVEIA